MVTGRAAAALAGIVADYVLKGMLGILYGAAYGVVGYYVAAGIEVTGAAEYWTWAWLLAWVAAGTVVLTVWTIRWTGLGAQVVIRQLRHRRYPTCTPPPRERGIHVP